MRELYEKIYIIGKNLSKGDKLGLHGKIEQKVIDVFSSCISAVYQNKEQKLETLHKLRIEIEVLKQLVRSEHELHIIKEKVYIDVSIKLQEISKMTNGWIKYLVTQNLAKARLF